MHRCTPWLVSSDTGRDGCDGAILLWLLSAASLVRPECCSDVKARLLCTSWLPSPHACCIQPLSRPSPAADDASSASSASLAALEGGMEADSAYTASHTPASGSASAAATAAVHDGAPGVPDGAEAPAFMQDSGHESYASGGSSGFAAFGACAGMGGSGAAGLVLPSLQQAGYELQEVVPGETVGQVGWWWGGGGSGTWQRVCRQSAGHWLLLLLMMMMFLLLRGRSDSCEPIPPSKSAMSTILTAQVLSRANHDAGEMLRSVGAAAAAAVASGELPPELGQRLLAAYSARMRGYTYMA